MRKQEDKDKLRDVSERGKKTEQLSREEYGKKWEEAAKRNIAYRKSGKWLTDTEDVHDLIPMPWMYKKNSDD